ncbi:MAG TPA: hypothetical protein VNX68_16065 [Nitrosopumilaceae archaeon]|jgi:hypothetical protein|nr:hypothetical protein [Nitrosopumilaceae archaeon]
MIETPKTANDVLKIINDFFIKTPKTFNENHAPTDEGHKLWDILTALRGPDNEDRTIKDEITAVIRNKALPSCDKYGAIVCSDAPDSGRIRYAIHTKAIVEHSDIIHFFFHAKRAFNALGLKWEEVNE